MNRSTLKGLAWLFIVSFCLSLSAKPQPYDSAFHTFQYTEKESPVVIANLGISEETINPAILEPAVMNFMHKHGLNLQAEDVYVHVKKNILFIMIRRSRDRLTLLQEAKIKLSQPKPAPAIPI